MIKDELLTIRDWIRFAASTFAHHNLLFNLGFNSVLNDAKSLVFFAIHLEINDDYLDARLTDDEKKIINTLIQTKLKTKKPTAYLTHQAQFAGLNFFVDDRVLVPRSPISELIGNLFSPWIDYQSTKYILDLCTGSGCIAIACAYAFPDAKIDAVDLSKSALEVALINQQKHGVEQQVQFFEGDLFTAVPDNKKYNLIISNPPYVDAKDMANLPDEIKHEPKIGLSSGQDGLNIVKKILKQAVYFLTDNGILIVEVGNSKTALIQQYPQVDFIWLEFQYGGDGVFLLNKQQLQIMLDNQ